MRKELILSILFMMPMSVFAWHTDPCPDAEPACFSLPPEHKPLQPSADELKSGRMVFGFGGDGCLASSPVYLKDEEVVSNPGIPTRGSIDGHCAYGDQLDRAFITFQEVQAKSPSNYKARIFGVYTVKDQIALGPQAHRHDWEHAIVWLKDDKPEYIGLSQHKNLKIWKASDFPYLKDSKAFAAKYVVQGSHSLGKADGVESGGQFIPKNTNPTPSKKWFGEDLTQYVKFDGVGDVSEKFKKAIKAEKVYGEAVPRFDDLVYLQEKMPEAWKEAKVKFTD